MMQPGKVGSLVIRRMSNGSPQHPSEAGGSEMP
jgi:hypothetical protein